MRNKLIDIILETTAVKDADACDHAEWLADRLISRGVTIRNKAEWREVRIVRYDGTKPYTQFAHECSSCKWLNKKKKGWNHNYCPNCSADMKGAKNDEKNL